MTTNERIIREKWLEAWEDLGALVRSAAPLPSVFGHDNDTHHDYPERPGTRRPPVTGSRLG